MSKLLKIIKHNFGFEKDFSSWELHLITKINLKVIQMNLKRMHNREILYFNNKYDIYRLKTDEDIKKSRIEVNEFIDKYNLKQKKYII